LDLKNLIDLGGFCKICKTQTDLGNSPSHRGLSAKWPYLLLPLDRNRTVARGYSGGSGGWWRQRPGGRGARVSGEKWRVDHGEHEGALTGRRDGRRTADIGEEKLWRLKAVAVFRCSIGDDEGLRRCNVSTWTSRWPRLGRADDGGGESGYGGELAGSAWPKRRRCTGGLPATASARVRRGQGSGRGAWG
jgi:hypothetical protein